MNHALRQGTFCSFAMLVTAALTTKSPWLSVQPSAVLKVDLQLSDWLTDHLISCWTNPLIASFIMHCLISWRQTDQAAYFIK